MTSQVLKVKKTLIIVCASIISFGSWHACNAQTQDIPYSNLEIRFALDSAPERDRNSLKELPDGPLKIAPETNGIADIVFWLDVKRHPDLKDIMIPKLSVEHEIKPAKNSWEPRFVTAMIGDQILYDARNVQEVYLPTGIVDYSNAFPNSGRQQFKLLTENEVPRRYDCVIHRQLRGYILTLPHRWSAVSNPAGSVLLERVPAGSRDFRIWHERCGWVNMVKVNGEYNRLDRGVLKLELQPDAVCRYEILIPIDVFKLPKLKAEPKNPNPSSR